jgi:ribose transport system substrate-binding protein
MRMSVLWRRVNTRGRSSRRRRTRMAVAGAIMASLAIVLSACGSSPSSATNGSKPQAGPTAAEKQLLANLAALEGYPKFTPPGPALDAKRLPSSTLVAVIDNTPSVGPLEQASAGIISAAKTVGVTTKLLNGGADNTPSDDISLLEEAVNLHPAVVLQVGILTALEAAGLKYAKASHVPVIAVEDAPPVGGVAGEGSGPYIAGAAQQNDYAEGKAVAEYVGAHGPADASIGVITSNDIVPSNDIYSGFTTELHSVCPKCTVFSQNVDTADWTTEVTPTVTSMLDAHPTMTYLFPDVDGMAPWVTPALTAATHRPTVISVNATPGASMSAVKSGLFTAEAGDSWTLNGWYAFDAALRTMLHLPVQTNPAEPVTFFTTTEMKAKNLNPNSSALLFGDAFQAGFRKLWGLG